VKSTELDWSFILPGYYQYSNYYDYVFYYDYNSYYCSSYDDDCYF
jgi:hypothetical protein